MSESTITLNGQVKQLASTLPLNELLVAEGIVRDTIAPPVGIAVAVNERLIRRNLWAETLLQPGDRVEVVQARQGG